MRIEPHPNGFVARVEGVELRTLDADHAAAIDDAWQRYPILVFPAQRALDDASHIAFIERFGPPLEERLPGEKRSFVSNADGHATDEMGDVYRFGALTPHMDFTYTRFPADGISLHALVLPAAGAQTRFYSNSAPLERMPRDLADRLDGYTIRCVLELDAPRTDQCLYREPRAKEGAMTQHHEWPLVRDHPRRPGTRVLFCTQQQTERIVELSNAADDDADSRALLGRIFDAYLYSAENTYTHQWKAGELVLWDNLAVQHAREAIPRGAGERTFRRVSFCHEGNGIEETTRFLGLANASEAFA